MLLADILEARAKLVRSPTGRPHALIGSTAYACDSEEFVGWCAAALWNDFRMTISKTTIEEVVRPLTHQRPTQPIPVRFGGDRTRITVDLGSSALAITSAGIAPAPEAVFARPAGSVSLPPPIVPRCPAEAAAALEDLRGELGVQRSVLVKCLAWLLAALRPCGPYPLLYLRGENGSGKSVLASGLRSLIDPRRPQLISLPKDPHNLAITAENMHVLGFNNVSHICGEMSDALCRLATGEGFVTRSLYSNRDLAVFEVCSPVLMTSIVDAATRPDLLDRALIADLPPRADRRTEEELDAALDALRPRVLGALLYAASHAMRGAEATVPAQVRMRQAALFAVRAAPALGLDAAEIVGAYLDSRAAARGVAAEDPVVEALLGHLVPGKTWAGTMGQLLNAAQREAPRTTSEGVAGERPRARVCDRPPRAHPPRHGCEAHRARGP